MFVFLDTETTGTGPEDRLCQIAFKPEGGPAVCKLFNPGMPISVDAMAIHHITNRMVQGKPFFRGSETHTQLQKLTGNERTVIVAHNARFDVDMLNKEGIYPPAGDLHFQTGTLSGQEWCHPQVQPPVSPVFAGT